MSIDPKLYKFMQAVPKDQRNQVLNDLAAAFYKPAPWSNITPHVSDTRQANGGTGVAFYYRDPATQQIFIPMVVPVKLIGGSINPTGEAEKYQIPGGHINFAEQETLIQACLRETNEEAAGPNGPILDDIDPSQLVELDNMLIYPRDLPMHVNGFGLELSKDQFDKMKLYSNKQIDITKHTKDNEIRGIKVLTLDDVLANPDNLNHGDQVSLFKKLQAYLSKAPEVKLAHQP